LLYSSTKELSMASPNLFISYAQSEEPFVRRLLPQLEEMGFEVWSPCGTDRAHG